MNNSKETPVIRSICSFLVRFPFIFVRPQQFHIFTRFPQTRSVYRNHFLLALPVKNACERRSHAFPTHHTLALIQH